MLCRNINVMADTQFSRPHTASHLRSLSLSPLSPRESRSSSIPSQHQDLGLSVFREALSPYSSTVCGTPRFMAPEVVAPVLIIAIAKSV